MTAKEFLEVNKQSWETEQGSEVIDNIEEMMIEFAKYHVEKALDNASDNAEVEDVGNPDHDGDWKPYYVVDRKSIINAYPLENIK